MNNNNNPITKGVAICYPQRFNGTITLACPVRQSKWPGCCGVILLVSSLACLHFCHLLLTLLVLFLCVVGGHFAGDGKCGEYFTSFCCTELPLFPSSHPPLFKLLVCSYEPPLCLVYYSCLSFCLFQFACHLHVSTSPFFFFNPSRAGQGLFHDYYFSFQRVGRIENCGNVQKMWSSERMRIYHMQV